MRVIFKILAAPSVLALTLAVAILTFLYRIAGVVLNIICGLAVLAALFSLFVENDSFWGIRCLVLAFCCSSAGLPAAAEWLIVRLDDLNYSLRGFIAS